MQEKNASADARQVRAGRVFFLQWQKRDHKVALSSRAAEIFPS
jgi:hypothetical protein